MAARVLSGRVRKLHHVGVGFREEIETSSEIGVQHVETTRSEREVASLRVHDHLVAERNRAGEPRVRDARFTVHFEPGQALDPLDDRGDAAAPKCQHLERHRQGRA